LRLEPAKALARSVLTALALGCSSPATPAKADAPPEQHAFAWSEAAPCPVPRFEAMAAVVNGEVWVMGGFLSSALDVTTRIDIYDPSRDAWRLGPELPGAQTHAGVVTDGNDIVLAGGFVGNVLDRVTTAKVWRWDSLDATFDAGPDLPSARAGVAMALAGHEIHVAGGLAEDGNTDSGDHVVWDLTGAGAWTSAPPLANPRNHGGGAAAGGLFYAASGRHGWDEIRGDDPELDAFDPATHDWQQRAPLPLERSEIGAATLVTSDGRLLVIGGSVPGKLPSADVLVYDPQTDAWSALPSLPEPRKGVAAGRVGSKVVVTTGSPTSTDPSAVTYVGCCLY
jgi:N-acetylneuraminic acid mutarotase